MRAFLAVPMPEGRSPPSAPAAIDHLTLLFLGEVPEELVARLVEHLTPAVAARPRFEMVLEGVGAFPSLERPRVVWRGVGEGREELVQLAGEVRRAALVAGARGDPTPFSPHLTLFRVRSERDRGRARDLLDGRRPAPSPTRVAVSEVVLVQSRLRPTGAEHSVLARFPLAVTRR